MSDRSRLAAAAVAVGLVVGTASVAVGAAGDGGTVRIALGLCGAGLLFVAALYAADGYREQAVAHGLAGGGVGLAALAGGGPAAWLGVGVAAAGVLLVIRDLWGGPGRRRSPT